MRTTDKEAVDYERLRKDYLKNFENFYDNIEVDLKDSKAMQDEVKQYMKISKQYKKKLKKNIDT